MKKVMILRGPSGAGKSTITKMYPSATVISTDDFFMQLVDINGKFEFPEAFMPEPTFEYKFDVAKLSEAHANSVKLFTEALKRGDELVILDNTNIKHWQFAHYISIAELAGYEVEVVSVIGFTIDDIKLCAERNAHNVPIDIVARMFYEFEPYEGEKIVMINGGEWQSGEE
jgi:predicted kinase